MAVLMLGVCRWLWIQLLCCSCFNQGSNGAYLGKPNSLIKTILSGSRDSASVQNTFPISPIGSDSLVNSLTSTGCVGMPGGPATACQGWSGQPLILLSLSPELISSRAGWDTFFKQILRQYPAGEMLMGAVDWTWCTLWEKIAEGQSVWEQRCTVLPFQGVPVAVFSLLFC